MKQAIDIKEFVLEHPNIQSGKLCFKNSRVPVQNLFWHLELGYTVDGFLENFPSVTKEQAQGVLEWLAQNFAIPNSVDNENFA